MKKKKMDAMCPHFRLGQFTCVFSQIQIFQFLFSFSFWNGFWNQPEQELKHSRIKNWVAIDFKNESSLFHIFHTFLIRPANNMIIMSECPN